MNSPSPAGATHGTAPVTVPTIEDIDRMTVNEKLAFYARREAYKLPLRDGDQVARTRRYEKDGLPKRLTPGSIQMDGGHITRQSYSFIGRPCFGIPTARLVHGREVKVQPKGRLVFTRCGECPLRAACDFVCDERLHANDEIREAYREFQRHGGRDAFWSPDKTRHRAIGSALRDLLRHLQAANFTTVNDAQVAALYEQKALKKREADAERQRKLREQQRCAISPPVTVRSDSSIANEAKALRERICDARRNANCPRWLHALDDELAERVWAVWSKLSALDRQSGATHVAQALEHKYPTSTLDALRKRVTTVLNRVKQLEALLRDSSKPVN